MASSWFPASWPAARAVTGYQVAGDGSLEPVPEQVFRIPAAGGLWTCAADLVRFGLTWASLLPGELAREALRPHAQQRDRAYVGLGWLLNPAMDMYGHQGTGPSGSTSLVIRQSSGLTASP